MNDTVTHANPSDKRDLDFVWIAPEDDEGTVMFQGAVLYNYSTFWVANSGPIRSARSAPCLAEQEKVLNSAGSGHSFLPECTESGTYEAVQCFGNRCFCVDEAGKAIENGMYAVDKAAADNMHCSCARDKNTYKGKGLLGKTFSCEVNGNYKATQCLGSVCFCADPVTGKKISGTSAVTRGDLASLQC